jgi:cell division septal protein FtsQ
MAGARGTARRQLVAAGRHKRRRRTDEAAVDPVLVRRLVRWTIVVGSTVLLLAVVAPWVVRVARTHPYFSVHEVAVRHRGELDAETIRRLAGVDVGTNVWDVDPEVAETRLLTNGWIRTAAVRRELPDRIVVHVREHRPVAILVVADETPGLYYLAANGRIFAPVGVADARDLPFVTGLRRADLGGNDAFGPRAVRRALALVRHAARQPRLAAASEVHVDRADGLTLVPTRPTLPIAIGWGEYDTKLARVAEVLPHWAGREGELESVTCTFDDDVVVRLRGRRGDGTGTKAGTKKTGKGAGKPSATGA